jgi:hypothetical protein
MQPSVVTMHVALIGGDPSMIRSVWSAVGVAVWENGQREYAATRHQRREALRWLLCGLSTSDLAKFAVMGARERFAVGRLALSDLDFISSQGRRRMCSLRWRSGIRSSSAGWWHCRLES